MLINLNQSLLIYHRMFYYDYLCNYLRLYNLYFVNDTGTYSRFHKTFAKIFQISFQSSQVRCEVQKFILKFKSQFVNKALIGP